MVGLPIVWSQVDGVAYRMRRVMAFLDPTHDPAGASYQIDQALVALGHDPKKIRTERFGGTS